MQTGFPESMVVAPVDLQQYLALAEKGQDEAASFLRSGTCRANALTLCPASADVSSNECKSASALV